MSKGTIDLIKYKIHKASGTLHRYRSDLIAARLKNKGYYLNDQVAILMDRDKKPDEFEAYQAVRARIKAELDKEFEALENTL